MSSETHDSKRLAKNTLVLYVRMLFTVGISFYTARVILAGLGVSDYGLYNVIGGFVAMFYMVTSALSNAVTRFLTYEMGKGDSQRMSMTFVTSVNIMLLLSLFIISCAETIGLWFVNNKLVIDSSRLIVANWLYQLSLICFVVEMISVPYSSSVIAHEKMKAFAFVTIVNVLLKLIIALLIVHSPIDRLLFYAILMAIVSIFTQLLYWWYCRKKFVECKYYICFDKQIFKNMFVFSGWFFFTSISYLCSTQGINILLNMFFGTPVNAARGIANHLDNTVKAFSKNFMTALTPQITKYYAQGDLEYTKKLVYLGSKYSFLLLFVISYPVLLETNFLLNIWLTEVPPYCAKFVQLTLLLTMIEVLLSPFGTLNSATGNIKKYQIVIGGAQLLILPVSYVFLKLGAEPYWVLVVTIVVNMFVFVPRITLNRKCLNVTISDFFKTVIIKCLYVIIGVSLVTLPLYYYMNPGWRRFVIVALCSTVSMFVTIYFFALEINEKEKLRKFVLIYISGREKAS